ncbi:unnamed protein product [Caenorhabditis bovis]|uniref:Uncharacterized protein n=1 Tax=Caenorhabditis bovis TaxID=2654633 RepID=A0A8S1ED38_9PELO|nr:unnamed protein product [Caenorhabditis bovis]
MSMRFAAAVLIAVGCIGITIADEFDGDEPWDAFARDKTKFCRDMTQFAPNDIYCELFSNCCNQMYDPLNGDKCQVKQLECDLEPGESKPRGVCKYRNCTELITTTTTTTPQPILDAINGATQVVSLLSCFLVTVAALY